MGNFHWFTEHIDQDIWHLISNQKYLGLQKYNNVIED
jgi:hypothetical protein